MYSFAISEGKPHTAGVGCKTLIKSLSDESEFKTPVIFVFKTSNLLAYLPRFNTEAKSLAVILVRRKSNHSGVLWAGKGIFSGDGADDYGYGNALRSLGELQVHFHLVLNLFRSSEVNFICF